MDREGHDPLEISLDQDLIHKGGFSFSLYTQNEKWGKPLLGTR